MLTPNYSGRHFLKIIRRATSHICYAGVSHSCTAIHGTGMPFSLSPGQCLKVFAEEKHQGLRGPEKNAVAVV